MDVLKFQVIYKKLGQKPQGRYFIAAFCILGLYQFAVLTSHTHTQARAVHAFSLNILAGLYMYTYNYKSLLSSTQGIVEMQ